MTDLLAPDPDGTDALVRALRAPGSAAELAGAEQYLQLFRAGRDAGVPAVVPHRRRLLRRIGGGTALALVVAAGTGGVAAARQGELPAPLQGVAERVLSPVGVVPAPAPAVRPRSLPAPPSLTLVLPPGPTTTAGAARTERADAKDPRADAPAEPATPRSPTRPAQSAPGPAPSAPTKSGHQTPSPRQGTPPPVVTPPPVPEPPVEPVEPVEPAPVALADVTAPTSVEVGATATLAATVVDVTGLPLADVVVVLEVVGPDGWAVVAEGTSDASGRVSLTSGALAGAVDLRLRTGEAVAVAHVEVTGEPSHP